MKQVWIKAEFEHGGYQGDRLLVTLPDAAADKVAESLDAEMRDMHLAVEVWTVED